MNKIRESIEKGIMNAGRGYVFTRKDFQDVAPSGSIDNSVIYFKHARPKEIYADSLVSGLVVPVLRYFGKDRTDDKIIAPLKQKLSRNEKKELLENIHYSTEWIYEVVQKIAKD